MRLTVAVAGSLLVALPAAAGAADAPSLVGNWTRIAFSAAQVGEHAGFAPVTKPTLMHGDAQDWTMKIDAQDAVGARNLDQIRDELCTDGDAGLVLAILPRVAVVRHDARDTRRRCPSRGVDEQEQLHEVLGRCVRGLDDEDVRPADVLVDSDEDLTVRKA